MSAEPKPTDVCMGRGGRIYNRKMNQEYREFIQKRYEERHQQPGFRTDNLMETARELHREFFQAYPTSAFVKQVWVPADYQEGLMKTWDVLRAVERSIKERPTDFVPPGEAVGRQRAEKSGGCMSADPKATDVCMGRGGRIYNRKMNQIYREFIQQRYEQRHQQPGLRAGNLMETARELHREFSQAHPKSCFVKQVWIPADYQEGLMKTWDVLRAMERSEKSTPTTVVSPMAAEPMDQGQGPILLDDEDCNRGRMVDLNAVDVLPMSSDYQTKQHPFLVARTAHGGLDSLAAVAEARLCHDDTVEPIVIMWGSGTIASAHFDAVSKEMSEYSCLWLRGTTDERSVRMAQALQGNTKLTRLSLAGNKIGQVGMTALAQSLIHNSSLRSLCLSDNELGDDEAVAMSYALNQNMGLVKLDLSRNNIGIVGASALSKSLVLNPTLTILELGRNKIGPTGACDIAESLKLNPTLTTLDLHFNEIGDTGLVEIGAALQVNGTLACLNLQANEIGNAGAVAVGAALQVNSTLARLIIDQNAIGDTGAAALGEALKTNNALRHLRLSWNRIGDHGAVALGEGLRVNRTLTALELHGNQIRDRGVSALAGMFNCSCHYDELNPEDNCAGDVRARSLAAPLGDSPLIWVSLGSNCFSHDGTASIANALKQNANVVTMLLPGNCIDNYGADLLAKALEQTSTLETLGLACNRIRDKGAASLAKALKHNTALKELDLRSNRIRDGGATALAKVLGHNCTLKDLNLRSNRIRDAGAAAFAKLGHRF
jgi:Ran GTPase-activating protein (RanGAP) involved in mRNA processing and transport